MRGREGRRKRWGAKVGEKERHKSEGEEGKREKGEDGSSENFACFPLGLSMGIALARRLRAGRYRGNNKRRKQNSKVNKGEGEDENIHVCVAR